MRSIWIVISFLILTQCVQAGEYVQVVDAGLNFHTGSLSKSLNGASTYFLGLRAQKRKQVLRPEAGAELQFGSGVAYLEETKYAFSLYGGRFAIGAALYPFTIERFQPFFGVNGLIGWTLLKIPAPPSGLEPDTQGIAYGYELSAGIDMRLGSAEGNAIRIRSSYYSYSSSLAGQSGFALSAFRMSLGLVF